MSEKIRPASRRGIAGGDGRHRQWPVDRQIRIAVSDTDILRGVVRTIDPVAHVGRRGDSLKPVQETRRHVEMTKVLVVEQECLLMPEGRRAPSNVDEHIVYRTVGAPNQLRLAP